MPKMVLHLKCAICISVPIGNQVAKLKEPLKEVLKNSKLNQGGKNHKSCSKLLSLAQLQLKQR